MRCVSFGRRDGNFRPRPRVDNLIGFAGNRGADDVGYRQSFRAQTFGFFQRGKCVGSFAGLADDYNQSFFVDNRIAVTVFAGQVDFNQFARKFFDIKFPDKSRVIGRAASDDINFVDAVKKIFRPVQLVEDD